MGAKEEWEVSGRRRKARLSPALVVAARMVYRDASTTAPVSELQNAIKIVLNREQVANHLLVTSVWSEVSLPDDQPFSNIIFAVIGAFDVDKVREELVINVPWIPTLDV